MLIDSPPFGQKGPGQGHLTKCVFRVAGLVLWGCFGPVAGVGPSFGLRPGRRPPRRASPRIPKPTAPNGKNPCPKAPAPQDPREIPKPIADKWNPTGKLKRSVAIASEGVDAVRFLPSALDVEVMSFKQARTNGGSNYDSID